MKPFSPQQLEMLWEAVMFQIGSLEYLAQHDPYFLSRITELKALAREIEERMLEQGENP